MEATISCTTETTKTGWRPEFIEAKHFAEWCVVNYDDKACPGIIIEAEEHNIMVKCIHWNGLNKLYWPSPRKDVTWYAD